MTDPVNRLSAALADHTLIERELGQGGMGDPAGRGTGGPADGGSDV